MNNEDTVKTQARRPHRIFLSSTSKDLSVHRAKLLEVLARDGQLSIAMEYFGAQDGDAMQVSLAEVGKADVFVGVVAWRYGYIPDGETRSVTHLEYEEAKRLNLPRYIFLADPLTAANEGQDAIFPSNLRDPENYALLMRFRSELETDRVVDWFSSADDLETVWKAV